MKGNMSNNQETYYSSIDQTLTIRRAGAHDDPAITRLAELDTAPALQGLCLIAERDGAPIAACQIGSGRVVADPFQHTADIVELLEARARSLRHEGGDSGGRVSIRGLSGIRASIHSPATSSAIRRGTGAA
jgi:hypothetical protein